MHHLFNLVLGQKDLSRAGDLFSLDDFEIEDSLSEALEQIRQISSSEDYQTNDNDQAVVEICITRITTAIRETESIEKHSKALVSLWESCLERNLKSAAKDEDTPHAKIASDIMSCILQNYNRPAIMSQAVPVAVKFLHRGNKELCRNMSNYISLVAITKADLLADHTEAIINSILQGNSLLLCVLPSVYEMQPQPINLHLKELVSKMPHLKEGEQHHILKLLQAVARRKQTTVLKETIPLLMGYLSDASYSEIILNILIELSTYEPLSLASSLSTLKDIGENFPNLIGQIAKIYGALGQVDEGLARVCLTYLVNQLNNIEHSYHHILLMEIKNITGTFNAILGNHTRDIYRMSNSFTSIAMILSQYLGNETSPVRMGSLGFNGARKVEKTEHLLFMHKPDHVYSSEELNVDQNVIVKLDDEKKWKTPATVIGRSPEPRSYVVLAEEGTVTCRNRIHLQPVPESLRLDASEPQSVGFLVIKGGTYSQQDHSGDASVLSADSQLPSTVSEDSSCKITSSGRVIHVETDPEGRFLVLVCRLNSQLFTLVNVYAPNQGQIKILRRILHLVEGLRQGTLVVGGDFNLVWDPQVDKKLPSGKVLDTYSLSVAPKFQNLIFQSSLYDVWRACHPDSRDYTYFSPPHGSYSRLDYFFVDSWSMNMVTSSNLCSCPWSDHDAMTMIIRIDGPISPRPTWKLPKFLWEDVSFLPELMEKVEDFLESNPVNQTSHQIRWAALKAYIRGFCIAKAATLKKLRGAPLGKLTCDLRAKERQNKKTPTASISEEILKLKSQIKNFELERIQLAFSRFKMTMYSKSNKAGSMLANKLKQQAAASRIPYIQQGGRKLYAPEDIGKAFAAFYEQLYNLNSHEKPKTASVKEISFFLEKLGLPSLPDEEGDSLTQPFTEVEIGLCEVRTLSSQVSCPAAGQMLLRNGLQLLEEDGGAVKFKRTDENTLNGENREEQKICVTIHSIDKQSPNDNHVPAKNCIYADDIICKEHNKDTTIKRSNNLAVNSLSRKCTNLDNSQEIENSDVFGLISFSHLLLNKEDERLASGADNGTSHVNTTLALNPITNYSEAKSVFDPSQENQSRANIIKEYLKQDKLFVHLKENLHELKNYVVEMVKKIPVPEQCVIEDTVKSCVAKLFFSCPTKGHYCLYSKSSFILFSRQPQLWIHIMFLFQQSLFPEPLSMQSTSMQVLKTLWEKTQLKGAHSFEASIIQSMFPHKKDLELLHLHLEDERFFDLFGYSEESGSWQCFMCNNPEKATVVNQEGQTLIEGKLKEKQIRWKFIKRWKTRYFTLAGNQLLFRKGKSKDDPDDCPIELSKVQSVKAVAKKRKDRSLPRAFEIFTDSKTYVFKAKDEKNAEEWLQCISVAVAQAKERESRESTTYL
ncbi:ventricular zone-expressed PH domain-containing protein homolog 1 [Bombina bombina]|uniref:ventricular zone-expressed PH domain-containing protein homolog 1 n=1 Tax=Bombina bombina TaxID=8345 RepID=UPI00235AEED6|nr:ventricular zone-expressed PH domain-containing protein homolog 1 [Bombina bombina]